MIRKALVRVIFGCFVIPNAIALSEMLCLTRAAKGSMRAKLELVPGVNECKSLVDATWVCKPGVDEIDPALLGDPMPAWRSNSDQMCRPVKAKIGRESLAIS